MASGEERARVSMTALSASRPLHLHLRHPPRVGGALLCEDVAFSSACLLPRRACCSQGGARAGVLICTDAVVASEAANGGHGLLGGRVIPRTKIGKVSDSVIQDTLRLCDRSMGHLLSVW